MKRRTLATIAVGAGAAAAGLGWAWWNHRSRPPDLTGSDLAWWHARFERPEGGSLALDDFKGQRLLLNFWATWCPPCVKEMPMLDAFARAQRAQGWQVVGLALDNTVAVRGFLKRVPVSFPVGIAGVEGLDLSLVLGNAQGQLPFTSVWDQRSRLLRSKLGTVTDEDLKDWATLQQQ
jgi:thiol-disulfide isomerase/thioredoxin